MKKSCFAIALALGFSLVGTASPQPVPREGGGVPPSDKPAQDQPSLPLREPMQLGASGVGVSLEVEPVVSKRIGGQYVYSAKYLCGKIPHSVLDPQDPPLEFPLVPGTYRTAININNPNLSSVSFTKLALTTNPEKQPRGKAGAPVTENLAANEGLEVDCQDIEGLLIDRGSGVDLSNNSNNAAVFNNPPYPTLVTLIDPAVIKQLVTYHWNNGTGDPPGTISLRSQSGTVFGPFAARGFPGQNGAPNVNWVADLNQLIPAGVYTVVDSKPQTWSYNQQSLFAGFAIVRGSYSFVGRAPFFKGFVVIRSTKELDVVGVYTLKNVISSVPNPPLAAPPPPSPPPPPSTTYSPCHANSASFVELAKPVCAGPPGTVLTLYVSRAGMAAAPTVAHFRAGPGQEPIAASLNSAINLPGLPVDLSEPVIPAAGATLAPQSAYTVVIPPGACFSGPGRTWYFDLWVPGSGDVDEVGVTC